MNTILIRTSGSCVALSEQTHSVTDSPLSGPIYPGVSRLPEPSTVRASLFSGPLRPLTSMMTRVCGIVISLFCVYQGKELATDIHFSLSSETPTGPCWPETLVH